MLNRRTLMGLAAALVASVGAGTGASADSIDGTVGLNNFGVTASASSLDTAGVTFTFSSVLGVDQFATTSRTGDYLTGLALGDGFASTVLDTADLGSFSFTSSLGTFQAQSAGSFIVSASANFIDIYLIGLFTPGVDAGPGLAGKDPTLSSVRYSFNLSSGSTGVSVAGGGTLSTPPAAVPEPASLAMAGLGLLGVGAVARQLRRRA